MRMMASLAAAAMLAAGNGTIIAESAGNAAAKARASSAQVEQDRQAPRGQMQVQVQRRRVECPPDIDLRPLRRADPMPLHKSPGTRAKARWKRARRSSRR